MKKLCLIFYAVFVLAGPLWADFADEDAAQKREAEQREQRQQREMEQKRRERERENVRKQNIIDGEWDEALLHISAYGMFGSGGAGGGLGMDWQLGRNFAWTFMDANYYAGSFNVSTLATVTWRPFFLELCAFAGPGLGLRTVSKERPKNVSGSYSTEEMETSFLFVFGASVGFHLGPGSVFVNMVFSDVHQGAFSAGYKLGLYSR